MRPCHHASVAVESRPARRRRSASSRQKLVLTAASGLGLGVAMIWFSLLVLIPLSRHRRQGVRWRLEHARRRPLQPADQVRLQLTVLSSWRHALNMVMGTIIAWVLVRDRFPGMAVLDLVIDIPFALPTIVAGLVLLSLYVGRTARSACRSTTPAGRCSSRWRS